MLFILTVNTVFIKIVFIRNISPRYDNTKRSVIIRNIMLILIHCVGKIERRKEADIPIAPPLYS